MSETLAMSGWVDEGPMRSSRTFSEGLRAFIKPAGDEVQVRVVRPLGETRLVAYAPTLEEAKQYAEAFRRAAQVPRVVE